MRSEFQDVFKDAYDHWIDDACSHRYHASQGLALQVWQHQQSKVDELQYKSKLRESDYQALLAKYQVTKKCWNDRSKENGELKERLDSIIHQAKEFIQSCKNDADIFEDTNAAGKAYGAEAVVELLEQALKGGIK